LQALLNYSWSKTNVTNNQGASSEQPGA